MLVPSEVERRTLHTLLHICEQGLLSSSVLGCCRSQSPDGSLAAEIMCGPPAKPLVQAHTWGPTHLAPLSGRLIEVQGTQTEVDAE